MSKEEAKAILQEEFNDNPNGFEISDAGFGDGCKEVSYCYLFNNEEEANKFIKAIYTLAE